MGALGQDTVSRASEICLIMAQAIEVSELAFCFRELRCDACDLAQELAGEKDCLAGMELSVIHTAH